MQSCMMPFQASPVAMRNSVSIENPNVSKLAYLLRKLPVIRTLPNRFIPSTAKMKKNRNRTAPTLVKAGSE